MSLEFLWKLLQLIGKKFANYHIIMSFKLLGKYKYPLIN